MVRRIFDILFSFTGIIGLLPLLPIIGLIIKLDSRGPLFYRADRIGKDMQLFKMLKFRTMIETPIEVGACVCPQGDVRVTRVGRFLRRSKLNELPQLINILKGDMTFVGPRPEAPELVSLYPDDARKIFSVKPGLVGPNDLACISGDISGRNEEELYPPGVDPKKFYIEEILPPKLQIDLEHIENQSMLNYFKFILLGVWETLVGSITLRHVQHNRIQISLALADTVLTFLSLVLACGLYHQHIPGKENFTQFVLFAIMVVCVRQFSNIFLGIYSSLLEFYSKHDFVRIVKSIATGSISIFIFCLVTGSENYTVAVALIDSILLLLFLSMFRVTLKFFMCRDLKENRQAQKHNALIYGASETGIHAYKTLLARKNNNLNVIGFIDKDEAKHGKTLCCLKVLGNHYHLKDLAKLHQIEELILAEQDMDSAELNRIIEVCKEASLNYRLFTSIDEIQNGKNYSFPFRRLDIADLLSDEKQIIDQRVFKEGVADKIILVNGSGGSLGLEICRRALQAGCRKLIIADRYESYLTDLVMELLHEFSNDLILPVVLDAHSDDALVAVFKDYRPEVVFHTCMKKYITFCDTELNHVAATNYARTFKFARLAKQFKCETFILISSIDAGAADDFINESLRIAEISLEYFFKETPTRLIITKYGNIIENRGGIVSAIDAQIRTQQKVTLPDVETPTYQISKDTAADLIFESLSKASDTSSNNGIYIVEKGIALTFVEIARRISNLYGLKLGSDVTIEFMDSCPVPQNKFTGPITENVPATVLQEHFPAANDDLNSDELGYVFKNFVSNSSRNFTTEDWISKTRELANLSGRSLLYNES